MGVELHPDLQRFPGWVDMAQHADYRLAEEGLNYRIYIRPATPEEEAEFWAVLGDAAGGCTFSIDEQERYMELVVSLQSLPKPSSLNIFGS
jgi:hypothetical protein